MLLSQAAGIVISLLVAFSLVALVAAGTMLAAGAHADVQRRLSAFGVQRALGFTPARIASLQAAEAALVAVPAALLGLAVGALAVAGPSAGLLAALNERRPAGSCSRRWRCALLAVVASSSRAATWPAWRAARRPPAEILRGGEHARRARRGSRAPRRPARPRRALLDRRARALARVRGDDRRLRGRRGADARARLAARAAARRPGTVGKRYQLTRRRAEYLLPSIRGMPGVDAAGARYSVEAADSFRLGEPLRLVAYPRRPHRVRGAAARGGPARARRPARSRSASGWPTRSGCGRARTLAAQLPERRRGALPRRRGSCARSRTTAGSRWVQPEPAARRRPGPRARLVVRLDAGRRPRRRRRAALTGLGARAARRVGARRPATARSSRVLAAVLRGVGLAVGLVCLYALVQALTMTARERRGAVALLRACGGDARAVATVLAGAAAAVALPAALAGVVLERAVLGPLVGAARRRLRVAAAGARARPRRDRAARPARAAPPARPRWSRGACCASPSSPG